MPEVGQPRAAVVERHQHVVETESSEPLHIFEVGEVALVESVNVGLPQVHLLVVILAEHPKGLDLGDG